MIGIGMFVLVAFFAGTHTKPALPSPLARTQAVLLQTAPTASLEENRFAHALPSLASKSPAGSDKSVKLHAANNNIAMIFMALVFSALLTLTIQFWRNLRRAYASPRRKWGKG